MAKSGSYSVAATSYDRIVFEWSISSQNVTSNTSTVSWALKLVADDNGRISSSAAKLWSVTVNGVAYNGTNYIGIENNATKTLASGTTTIAHNTDGTKTFSFSFSQQLRINFGGSFIDTITGSSTGTLDTIARSTTPTLSSSSVTMGSAVTITLNRLSSSFTHDLAYSFAGGSYVNIVTGVGTSYTWTTPDLAASIPNATSGTVTIRCITKNGSSTVGTKTVVMTLKVPTTSAYMPSVSALTATEATSGLAAQFGAFIQGKSTLAVKVTAAGAKGSTISSYKTTVQGNAYTGATFTSNALLQAGAHSITTTVTDSRGRTATKTISINVLEYTLPKTTTFKAFRCDKNGTAKDDGTYLSVTYAYSVASCGGKNTAAMVMEYKTETGSSWTSLTTGSALSASSTRFFSSGPTFSTDYQYNVRMTVTDWFGASASYEVTLPTADVVLDISSDGKGLGIGKVSQRSNATEFARTLYDQFDTLIGNGLAAYTGGSTGNIDANTTLEHLILTTVNTPTTAFWYVMTLFYSTKSETSNRAQLALPYSYQGPMYIRRYYNGAWQPWEASAVLTSDYDVGIWHVRTWADGWVELTGTYEVSDIACTTALGGWYRTAYFTPGAFPFEIVDPVVTANYESTGYGALLWATTEASGLSMPNYYLIRPTSTTIASGKIQIRVTGRMAD